MTLAATAAIALIAGGKPSEARAADGTTDVTVQVAEGDENLAWSVPTQIPMKAIAAGCVAPVICWLLGCRRVYCFPCLEGFYLLFFSRHGAHLLLVYSAIMRYTY